MRSASNHPSDRQQQHACKQASKPENACQKNGREGTCNHCPAAVKPAAVFISPPTTLWAIILPGLFAHSRSAGTY